MIITTNPDGVNGGGSPPVESLTTPVGAARKLRALAVRTTDPDLADLADEVTAIEDRLCHAENAQHHVCDLLGIDVRELPDPRRPRLDVPPADAAEVPE